MVVCALYDCENLGDFGSFTIGDIVGIQIGITMLVVGVCIGVAWRYGRAGGRDGPF